ncbi:MAG: alkaline phosphatase family protein [Alistipes sp.]
MKTIFSLLFCSILLPFTQPLTAKPRVVVNIVVSSLKADDLARYATHFEEGGFRRLMEGGVYFPEGFFNYQQTTTPVSLATLTTGAMPSTHGVVCSHWRDYVENKTISLVADPVAVGLDYPNGGGNFSPRNLIVPTLSETLITFSPQSRIATVAIDPQSSIVMSGRGGITFWMASECQWRSSSFYAPVLPNWVKKYNKEQASTAYLLPAWQTLLLDSVYHNTRRADILLTQPDAKKKQSNSKREAGHIQTISCTLSYKNNLDRMRYTPAGNTATFAFAKMALTQLNLGTDTTPDLLNICLDAPRYIAEAYGPESIEVEDMYYRLDRDLADFLTYLFAQVKPEETVVVLTSDHGTSASFDFGKEVRERFNVPQFEIILNSFLCARYGKGSWLLEYEDHMLYLNHNLIYEKGLSLADVQNEVATFAMQFRGVSHALSATAMRTSYFGSGYAEKMQNSFYPRRSGDVMLNLMPGWIEERDNCRSCAGSMYGYDTRVPLLFYGGGLTPQKSTRKVDMTAVAPTTAALLGIPEPAASEGVRLNEIIDKN